MIGGEHVEQTCAVNTSNNNRPNPLQRPENESFSRRQHVLFDRGNPAKITAFIVRRV